MTSRPWLIILILMLAVLTIATSGCVSDSDTLPQDKYVAIEEQQKTYCTLINGTYPFPPHTNVPQPFVYDNSANGSNWAEGSSWMGGYVHYDYTGVNDSFKALLGTSYFQEVAPRETRWGQLKVCSVYSYPYTGESGFTIRNIGGNGTVYASYNDTSIIVRPGEQWISPTFSETKSANGTGLHGEPYSYTAYFNTTWTVSNLGVVNKANLTGQYHSP